MQRPACKQRHGPRLRAPARLLLPGALAAPLVLQALQEGRGVVRQLRHNAVANHLWLAAARLARHRPPHGAAAARRAVARRRRSARAAGLAPAAACSAAPAAAAAAAVHVEGHKEEEQGDEALQAAAAAAVGVSEGSWQRPQARRAVALIAMRLQRSAATAAPLTAPIATGSRRLPFLRFSLGPGRAVATGVPLAPISTSGVPSRGIRAPSQLLKALAGRGGRANAIRGAA